MRKTTTKDYRLAARATGREKKAIEKKAKERNLSVGRYIVKSCLEKDMDSDIEMAMLLRSIADAYVKKTGDRKYIEKVDTLLEERGL